ncbi:MAG TPA: cell division protein ZapA [Candidatus Eisenbergiella intestinipullorum]|nr:cell division protein ZapA [Candidatus Eisenbergiella intestinipullorum]
MAVKTDTEVIIGGKVFTLSGYESEEYLQRVASYLNNKLAEYNRLEGFTRQPPARQNILMQLNIADDYFKARKQVALQEEELQTKEKELYDLKHELIATQMKLENAEKSLKSAQKELNDSSRKIVRLETELADRKEHGDRNKKE